MDDEPGHVIDGTERASQWRRSRSTAPAGEQADEPRSEAPKSIASSLLVPADLVQTTIAESNATAAPGEGLVERGGVPSEHEGASSDSPTARPEHRNPFLAQQSADAVASHGKSGPSRRDRVWAGAIAVAGGARRRLRTRHGPQAETSRRRTRAVARVRPAAVALGVLICAIGVGVMARLSASSAPVRSSHIGVIAASLERVSPALLAAVGNSVAEIPRSVPARANASSSVHAKRPPSIRKARTPANAVVAARYILPSSSRSSGGGTGGSFGRRAPAARRRRPLRSQPRTLRPLEESEAPSPQGRLRPARRRQRLGPPPRAAHHRPARSEPRARSAQDRPPMAKPLTPRR